MVCYLDVAEHDGAAVNGVALRVGADELPKSTSASATTSAARSRASSTSASAVASGPAWAGAPGARGPGAGAGSAAWPSRAATTSACWPASTLLRQRQALREARPSRRTSRSPTWRSSATRRWPCRAAHAEPACGSSTSSRWRRRPTRRSSPTGRAPATLAARVGASSCIARCARTSTSASSRWRPWTPDALAAAQSLYEVVARGGRARRDRGGHAHQPLRGSRTRGQTLHGRLGAHPPGARGPAGLPRDAPAPQPRCSRPALRRHRPLVQPAGVPPRAAAARGTGGRRGPPVSPRIRRSTRSSAADFAHNARQAQECSA